MGGGNIRSCLIGNPTATFDRHLDFVTIFLFVHLCAPVFLSTLPSSFLSRCALRALSGSHSLSHTLSLSFLLLLQVLSLTVSAARSFARQLSDRKTFPSISFLTDFGPRVGCHFDFCLQVLASLAAINS
jgi:hypothetical protein